MTTLAGVELRYLIRSFHNKPFIVFTGEREGDVLTQKSLSMLSWNVCCVSGGYSITDGGVLPWRDRIEKIGSTLLKVDADVVCLYEIFDIQTALKLYQTLKTTYAQFYFHMGPSVLGLSSGLFVASKFIINDPEFFPFSIERLDGRAKYCNKGCFAFAIPQEEGKKIHIFSTHLQHSEIPQTPTVTELEARKKEISFILEKLLPVPQGEICLLTGDLNLDDTEYHSLNLGNDFEKGELLGEGFTWGGDLFCSILNGKVPSCPSNLDHTLIRKGDAAHISTQFIETGFEGSTFYSEALSDHKGLLTHIRLE